MENRTFSPGFRLSLLDIAILLTGAIVAFAFAKAVFWVGIAIAFVVLHFFLFCNILRMSRRLELTWAFVFLALASPAIAYHQPSWRIVFIVSTSTTIALAIVELRKPSYHGLAWKIINPGLPEWWQACGLAKHLSTRSVE